MENTILEINNLDKSFGKSKVLSDINLKINRGDIFGLVGSNGAGKTTIMRIVCGQSCFEKGSISLFGKTSQKEIENERSRTGSLIEEPGFFPCMTAKQNLEYYRLQFGIPGKSIVDESLKMVGLYDSKNKKYKKFSLGMKQRLGLALAFMHSPEFLILDEPINGLDPAGIIEVRNIILKLNKERNTTILISSHILAELSNIVTKYGFIHKGEILEQIGSDELLKKCNEYIDLEVNEPEKMVTILEKDLNISNYKVYPDKHIHIYSNLDDSSKINKTAITNDIDVISINRRAVNLENYYMNLIGGEKNE